MAMAGCRPGAAVMPLGRKRPSGGGAAPPNMALAPSWLLGLLPRTCRCCRHPRAGLPSRSGKDSSLPVLRAASATHMPRDRTHH